MSESDILSALNAYNKRLSEVWTAIENKKTADQERDLETVQRLTRIETTLASLVVDKTNELEDKKKEARDKEEKDMLMTKLETKVKWNLRLTAVVITQFIGHSSWIIWSHMWKP
jgi:hypothetical protein